MCACLRLIMRQRFQFRLQWVGLICIAGWLVVGLGCASSSPPWRGKGAVPVALGGSPNARGVETSASDATELADTDTSANRANTTQSRSFTAMTRPLMDLPNAGLQLPQVSPNGRLVAYQRSGMDSSIHPDGLVNGRGMAAVSLWVRPTEAMNKQLTEPKPVQVGVRGAAWASWSQDSQQLVFVTRDANDACYLGVFDVATGETRRRSFGLRNMLMPQFSPDGAKVAVVAYGEIPDRSLVFIVDLATGQAVPGPPPVSGLERAQILPRWVDRQTLTYWQLGDASKRQPATLRSWTLGTQRSTVLLELAAPDSIFDAQFLYAGTASAFTRDRRWHVHNDLSRQTVVISFIDGQNVFVLPDGEQAVAWWDNDWLVMANGERSQLLHVDSLRRVQRQAAATDVMDGGEGVEQFRLLPGQWAPVWADADQQFVLMLGQGETRDTFKLIQLWLVMGE